MFTNTRLSLANLLELLIVAILAPQEKVQYHPARHSVANQLKRLIWLLIKPAATFKPYTTKVMDWKGVWLVNDVPVAFEGNDGSFCTGLWHPHPAVPRYT